jgi:hypothetical protein
MKLPKRRLFLAIMATLVGTAGLGWFVATRASPELQQFRQIRVGMELKDAKRLFESREPECIGSESRNCIFWSWSLDEIDVLVTVDAE